MLALVSTVRHPHSCRLYIRSSHRLALLTYHHYHFPGVIFEAHPVKEVGKHVKLPLDPLLPHRFQEAIFRIEKGRHLPGRPPKPIRSRFLPGYFRHPLAEDRVNYHIEDGGG